MNQSHNKRPRGGFLRLPASNIKVCFLFALSLFFTYAGITHFTNAAFYVGIMPPWIPAHLELVYISGVCEIMAGIGVLIPRLRSLAGVGLVALLIAVSIHHSCRSRSNCLKQRHCLVCLLACLLVSRVWLGMPRVPTGLQ